LVVLPRAEYEALVERAAEADEDAFDVAIYDARRAEASPVLPADVSMAMLRGESRLRAQRQWRDVGQVQLAYKTEISQGFLSDLENGKRNMTAEMRRRIAKVLEVPEDWLK
jgi:predicted transcriptional regulator